MGCVCKKQRRVGHEDPSVLASQTCFNEAEIEALHELFQKLSKCLSNDNLISKEEFQLGLFKDMKRQSLSADRIFELFDLKNDGVIDFQEFVRTLNIFHPNAPREDKTIFAFQLYDTWQTGFIEREELREMIVEVLDESDVILPENIIDLIIDKTFEEADLKSDGRIDLEEWEAFVTANPSLLKNMTIPYLKDLPRVFPSFVQTPDMDADF